jgi:hypothetical protein
MLAKTQYGILLLLVSCAAAQSAAPGKITVRHLRVVRDSANVWVEITLSAPINVRANVTLAKILTGWSSICRTRCRTRSSNKLP